MKISDEAWVLFNEVDQLFRQRCGKEAEYLIQRAIDAARNRALEDAAVRAREFKGMSGMTIADAIRAMKVQP